MEQTIAFGAQESTASPEARLVSRPLIPCHSANEPRCHTLASLSGTRRSDVVSEEKQKNFQALCSDHRQIRKTFSGILQWLDAIVVEHCHQPFIGQFHQLVCTNRRFPAPLSPIDPKVVGAIIGIFCASQLWRQHSVRGGASATTGLCRRPWSLSGCSMFRRRHASPAGQWPAPNRAQASTFSHLRQPSHAVCYWASLDIHYRP